MMFDVTYGIYWRPEEGGMLWGMSNPAEEPGIATTFDWDYYRTMAARLAEVVPVTATIGVRKLWAATIEYTPTTCRSSASASAPTDRSRARWSPAPAATG